jgi:hypothetical protein
VAATRAVLSSWRRRSYYLLCPYSLSSSLRRRNNQRTQTLQLIAACRSVFSFFLYLFMKHLADQLLALPNLLLLVFFSAKANPSDD